MQLFFLITGTCILYRREHISDSVNQFSSGYAAYTFYIVFSFGIALGRPFLVLLISTMTSENKMLSLKEMREGLNIRNTISNSKYQTELQFNVQSL